jgi:hypothetical protein
MSDRVAQRRATTGRGRNSANPVCYSSDTDIVRASKRQHAVQGSGSKANLGRLGLVGARSKGIADRPFVSSDRRLDLDPQIGRGSELAVFGSQRSHGSPRSMRAGFGSKMVLSGGGRPLRVKRAGAGSARGPAASANADGLGRSSIPAGFCRCVRHVGCA